MAAGYLAIRHPTDGELEFSSLNGQTRIRARWPFDLSTDEWIWLTVEIPTSDFSRALQDSLRTHQLQSATGPNGDTVNLTPARGSLEIDLIDGKVKPPKRLILSLDPNQLSELTSAFSAGSEAKDNAS